MPRTISFGVHPMNFNPGGFVNAENEGGSGVELAYNRYLAGTEGLVLGEKDIYEPLCRHCFNKAINKK